jgi:predicted PurR-regulated permease PerM
LWGLIGFIIGPLVLAAFIALWEFAMTGNERALAEKR